MLFIACIVYYRDAIDVVYLFTWHITLRCFLHRFDIVNLLLYVSVADFIHCIELLS